MNLYESLALECVREIEDFDQKVGLALLAPDSFREDLDALIDSVVLDYLMDNGYCPDGDCSFYYKIDNSRIIDTFLESEVIPVENRLIIRN